MILEYDFRVVGAQRVNQAFASIERRMVKHNRFAERQFGPKPRGSSARVGVGTQIADAQRTNALIERQRLATERKVSAEQRRALAAREREEAKLQRRELANAKAVGREQGRIMRMQQREAERAARVRAKFRQDTVGTIGRSVGRTTRAVGAGAAGLLAIGGSFAASGAVQSQLDVSRRIQNLIVQSRAPGATSSVDPKALREKVYATAIRTGQSREDVTAGLEMFVQRTGDLNKAVALMDEMGTIATAFGSTPDEIAASMTDIAEKFKIPAEQIGDMMAVIGAQGRQAAFELKDMASLLPRMAAAGERFGFTGETGVRVLGGAAQIARRSTGSSEEAATALENALRILIQKAPQIQSGTAFGSRRKPGRKVNVFEGGDPTQNARDYRDVVEDVIAASGGDITKLTKLFDVRGVRAVSPLITAFRSANQSAGGGETGELAGRMAIRDLFAEVVNSDAKYSDVQKDASEILASGVRDLTIAQDKLNKALGEELTPAVIKIANTIANHSESIGEAAEAVAKIADFLLENPFEGLGAIIALAVTKDIISAQIGRHIMSAIGGGTGMGAAGVGAAAGKGGKSRGSKAVGTLGLAGLAVGTLALADEALKYQPSMPEAGGTAQGLAGARSALSSGANAEAIKAQLAKAQERDAFLQNELQNTEDIKANPFMNAVNEAMFRNLYDDEYSRARERAGVGIGQDGEGAMKELKDQIAENARVIQALTAKLGEVGGLLAGASVPGASLNRSNSPTAPR